MFSSSWYELPLPSFVFSTCAVCNVFPLQALRASAPVQIQLQLLPDREMTEGALKRFYRTALHAHPVFAADGSLMGPSATFASLPQNPLLTLGIDAPAAWDVMAVKCEHDLDNLHLKSVRDPRIEAEFGLLHLLVEGVRWMVGKGGQSLVYCAYVVWLGTQ